MTNELPSGTVTFLFTDIEGSTPLWEGEPERMRAALAQHNALVRQAIDAQHGHVFKVVGDAFQAAFAQPAAAVAAALAAQRALEAAAWPTSTPLRVRMGLHSGAAELDGADYAVGHTLNRVARIMSAAHGGQVVLSAETAERVQAHRPPESGLKDLGQHRMKGLTQREHLFQLLAPGLPAEFPPLATLDARPNNLPRELTSFVGREQEIAELQARLTPAPAEGPEVGVRLLTLTAPGGTGKTRLSLQVAARVLEAFPDGAWLVELAPLTEPALVARSLAAALGVREQPGRALLEVLANYLRAKQLLLILDNCEHLITACAETAARLLQAAPGVKILASSREALGIAGETVYRVPPLTLPAAGHALALAALSQCEAVRLFVARAQLARPSFALTEQNRLAVAQVCRQLDGLPLALELAAARVKVLSVEQIAARLSDRFGLLTGGSRAALPRHQTLRALVDWSYELLSEPEKLMFRHLAVFSGGFTLAAAEAVGGPDSAAPALDTLARLIDKSLVEADASQGEDLRYRMLETLRHYGLEQLQAAGESEVAREQHGEWVGRHLEETDQQRQGAFPRTWLQALELERDNLRAALAWALDTGRAELAVRLAGASGWTWLEDGSYVEGRAWLERALALPGAAAYPAPYACSLLLAATLAYLQTEWQTAQLWLEQAAAMARAHAVPEVLAGALDILGLVAVEAGDLAQARANLLESRALFEQLGLRGGIAQAIWHLGLVVERSGDQLGALDLYEQALTLFRQCGDANRGCAVLRNVGYNHYELGRPARGRAALLESLSLARDVGNKAEAAYTLTAIAERLAPDSLQAVTLLGAAVNLFQALGLSTYEREVLEQEVAPWRAQLEPHVFDQALAAGRALTLDQAVTAAAA